MKFPTDLWPLAWETLQAFTVHYGPAIDRAAEQAGIPYGEWYGWLMAARIFEPSPVSAERLHVRAAYTNPALLDQRLQTGVKLGLLTAAGNGEYRLTDVGDEAVKRLIAAAYGAMAHLKPLPESDMPMLLGLLRRLVKASMNAPEPPGKWCLRIARHYDPEGKAGVMPQLDQYLSDLVAYRDDAHLAAWKPLGVSGQAWEVMTHLWNGDVPTLDDLCAVHCARRGYSKDDYAQAIDELMGRGWVVGEGGAFKLTQQGRALRDNAEETTNRFFFAPWAGLSEADLADLRRLLTACRDALQAAEVESPNRA